MQAAATRSIRLRVPVSATPEVVWSALTDPRKIETWLAVASRVDLHPGGVYAVSWGEGIDYEQVIEVADPPRRLQLKDARPEGAATVEFLIIPKGGGSVLELEHSGFAIGSEDDVYYEGTRKGWDIFLRNLRNSVNHPSGAPCKGFMRCVQTRRTAGDVWSQLVRLPVLKEGSHYEANWAEPVSGDVEVVTPPNMFLGTMDQLEGARIVWMVEDTGPTGCSVTMLLQTFGLSDERYSELRANWEMWLIKAVTL